MNGMGLDNQAYNYHRLQSFFPPDLLALQQLCVMFGGEHMLLLLLSRFQLAELIGLNEKVS